MRRLSKSGWFEQMQKKTHKKNHLIEIFLRIDTLSRSFGDVTGLGYDRVVPPFIFFLNRQGSWKTGEKEDGSSEEEKKLEEKVEENSQKAEV